MNILVLFGGPCFGHAMSKVAQYVANYDKWGFGTNYHEVYQDFVVMWHGLENQTQWQEIFVIRTCSKWSILNLEHGAFLKCLCLCVIIYSLEMVKEWFMIVECCPNESWQH